MRVTRVLHLSVVHKPDDPRVYELDGHDPRDETRALARIREWDYVADGPIALGTFLVRERPVFGDRFLEYGDAPIDVEAGVAEVLRGLT